MFRHTCTHRWNVALSAPNKASEKPRGDINLQELRSMFGLRVSFTSARVESQTRQAFGRLASNHKEHGAYKGYGVFTR